MPKAFRTATGITGLTLLILVMFAAIIGPFIAPYDPQAFHTDPEAAGDKQQDTGWHAGPLSTDDDESHIGHLLAGISTLDERLPSAYPP